MPLLASCLSFRQSDDNKSVTTFSLDTLKLYDQNRQREIPIAIYHPKIDISGKQKIVIFSHGYGQNKGGDYLAYSYLAEFLASKGYFVVSIQHELATDSLLPLTGNPQILRRPFWERGADNILFVVNELKKTNPDLDYKHITLIGHSNGGDMTALFPQKYLWFIIGITCIRNNLTKCYIERISLKLKSIHSIFTLFLDGEFCKPITVEFFKEFFTCTIIIFYLFMGYVAKNWL